MSRLRALDAALMQVIGERYSRRASLADEIAIAVPSREWLAVARSLRDAPELRFEMLMDLAGIDYLEFGQTEWKTASASGSGFSRGVSRGHSTEAAAAMPAACFAVVYQLLSVTHNVRLRVVVPCEGDEDPTVDSVEPVWRCADWFEREAFDLFGILFRGHPDLRRLLTDYGFIGHPFRKDFPLIGNVEVRYDPGKRRVVYEPVSIEPRVLVPKVIRHDNRYDGALKSPVKPS